MNNASFMFILISEESKLREYINVSSVSEKKRIWQRTGYKLECFFSRNEKWGKIGMELLCSSFDSSRDDWTNSWKGV